jgi:LPXTG-motif cell wall-anchored protein
MSNFNLLELFYLASTYGSDAYTTSVYNGAEMTIGPITLPVTGAALALGVIVALAIAAGLAVWLSQRKRHQRLSPSESPREA